jgi:hypothetical protein
VVVKGSLRAFRPSLGWYRFLRNQLLLLWWSLRGRPVPPPAQFKQRRVLEYRKARGLSVLVETGTYLGDMITATYGEFAEIYSIELSAELHHRACILFAKCPTVHLMHGDSALILRQVLEQITRPCLFWLDAHYSGSGTARGIQETPVLLELQCILSHPVTGHVILIDDARCFDGKGSYPALAELELLVRGRELGYSFEVVDDIIRIVPGTGAGEV